MGENKAVCLSHTPFTDFHSRSSKVLVGSRYNKTQSKSKGKNILESKLEFLFIFFSK